MFLVTHVHTSFGRIELSRYTRSREVNSNGGEQFHKLRESTSSSDAAIRLSTVWYGQGVRFGHNLSCCILPFIVNVVFFAFFA